MLEEYLSYALLGVAMGLFSNFFDDCLYPNMIFAKYGEWVSKLGFIGKPIGACAICTNFWISILISCYFFGFDLLQLLFIVGFSHLTITYLLIDKKPKIYGMKCCCENIYHVGCFSACDDLNISFDAIEGEEYVVIVKNNFNELRLWITANESGLIIPSGTLNESALHTISIFDENNDQVTFTIDDVEYDCLAVTTKIINSKDLTI